MNPTLPQCVLAFILVLSIAEASVDVEMKRSTRVVAAIVRASIIALAAYFGGFFG